MSRLSDAQNGPAIRTHGGCTVKPMLSLWKETWWLWIGFVGVTCAMTAIVGMFFLLLLPCLPVVFAYFAYARYDMNGEEKPDLD